MKYTELVEKEIEVKPCIRCGSTDIMFNNCGYSSFNVATCRCNNCGQQVEIKGISWSAKDHDLVPFWNEENDPDIVISKLQKQISELEQEILTIIKNLPDISK